MQPVQLPPRIRKQKFSILGWLFDAFCSLLFVISLLFILLLVAINMRKR